MANSGWPPSERERGRGLVLPILFIVVGSVLLLNNFGVLAWSIWPALAQLWPVILVLVGLELILGRRTSVLGTIVALVVVAVMVGWASHRAPGYIPRPVAPVVASVNQQVPSGPAGPASTTSAAPLLSVPLGDTRSAQVTVNAGAGDLRVGALPADNADLAQAEATLSGGEHLTRTTSSNDGQTNLTLATKGQGGFFWPFGSHEQPSDSLGVSLTRKVPLALHTNLGAGQSEVDLTDLSVQTLDVNCGGGQATVHLPSGAGRTRANVRMGAGNLTLVVPPNVGAYLHTNKGMVSVQLPPGHYSSVADGYQSDNYATASNQIDVYLQMGVGHVDVQ